ncbi:MAG: acyl-CoA reductase, partial [Bacteroidota bacterium]
MNHYLFGEETSQPLDRDRLLALLHQARENKAKLRDYPLSKILRALHEAGKKWADPHYQGRIEALAKLPDLIGFSREMVEKGLDYLAASLEHDGLLEDLTLQLGNPEFLDRFVYDQKYDGLLRAEPHGLLLHVSAGNVFVGAALHIVQGLLTKNVNLIKLSSADPVFPVLVARSVVEADPFLKHGLALMHWKGGDSEIEGMLKQSVDAISVFGGEEAVESYRHGLAPHVELFRHGPKVGLALVGKEALWDQDLADRLVHDAVMWDQNACSSPQLLYLEGEEKNAKDFIPLLAEAFRNAA